MPGFDLDMGVRAELQPLLRDQGFNEAREQVGGGVFQSGKRTAVDVGVFGPRRRILLLVQEAVGDIADTGNRAADQNSLVLRNLRDVAGGNL